MAGFDRGRGLFDAARHIRRGMAVEEPPLAQIQQCADALRDLLSSRLCRARHGPAGAAWPSRLAWLRAASSGQRGAALQPGPVRRTGQHDGGHRRLAVAALLQQCSEGGLVFWQDEWRLHTLREPEDIALPEFTPGYRTRACY